MTFVFGNSFDECLFNIETVLKRCEETHLVLNWEKCRFMVQEGVVLGHKISENAIEVDRAKTETIERLPLPSSVKAIKSFLGHKDMSFNFDDNCLAAFNLLKQKLTRSPILVSPYWPFPFELMCDASDYAIGAVLG
ncbi:hypothetical protein M9H77_12425 [Catharanthus roseus]|uniref:Uncharacterized protein n=1 Tax=Catharanthus roseus TaxID=4058 RepID=A0ACC0BHB7_CATRO|nr:hypothetical protein M9H77_12425 [Catharanthus roseus]